MAEVWIRQTGEPRHPIHIVGTRPRAQHESRGPSERPRGQEPIPIPLRSNAPKSPCFQAIGPSAQASQPWGPRAESCLPGALVLKLTQEPKPPSHWHGPKGPNLTRKGIQIKGTGWCKGPSRSWPRWVGVQAGHGPKCAWSCTRAGPNGPGQREGSVWIYMEAHMGTCAQPHSLGVVLPGAVTNDVRVDALGAFRRPAGGRRPT